MEHLQYFLWYGLATVIAIVYAARAYSRKGRSSMVGFANRQSFYAAFYRFEGITPRQYKLSSEPKPEKMKVPEPIEQDTQEQ